MPVDPQRSQDATVREGRIARSWRLSKIALGIIRSDPAMLTLALISMLFAAAALAVVYDITGVFSAHRHRDTAGQVALVTAVLAFPLTFVSVFFNTAIAAAAAGVLEGRRPTLRESLAVPLRRLGAPDHLGGPSKCEQSRRFVKRSMVAAQQR